MSNQSEKLNPNIKEFIRYLNHTLEMFDHYVDKEDYEKKESDVYKLFITLFRLYANASNQPGTDTELDSSILVQHLDKKQNLPWENRRIDVPSEQLVQQMYKKSLREIETTEYGPIIFTEDKIDAIK